MPYLKFRFYKDENVNEAAKNVNSVQDVFEAKGEF